MSRRRWALTIAAAVFTTAFIGGAALAGFQPFSSADLTVVGGPTATLADKDQPKDKLKAVLDGLVTKGTISQAQEDAILQALTAAQPAPKPDVPNAKPRTTTPSVLSFIGDLTKAAGE